MGSYRLKIKKVASMPRRILSIAGSDTSGGAGIQRDLNTLTALGVQCLTAITALTAQGDRHFEALNPVDSKTLSSQIKAAARLKPLSGVKIGMLGTAQNLWSVVQFLKKTKPPVVVLDPVLQSSSGGVLLQKKARPLLMSHLVPLCTVVTPNIPEAEILSGRKIKSVNDMKAAAAVLFEKGRGVGAVLIKGGHRKGQAMDVLFDGKKFFLFRSGRLRKRARGTGCVLSSAISAYLASGQTLPRAVRNAKAFVTRYIKAS